MEKVDTKLFQMFPENIQYGMSLAGAQLRRNHREAAAQTLLKVRQLPGGLPGHIDVDFLELFGLQFVDPEKSLVGAQALIVKAHDLNVPSIENEAHFVEARSLVFHGRFQEALTSMNRARELSDEIHDRDGRIEVAEVKANIYFTIGDYEHAQAEVDEGVRISSEMGTERRLVQLWSSWSEILAARGDLAGAKQKAQDAADLVVRRFPKRAGTAELPIVAVLLEQGELVSAASRLRSQREADERRGGGDGPMTLYATTKAHLEALHGDTAAARAAFAESQQRSQKFSGTTFAFAQKLLDAQISLREGKPADAEKSGHEAMQGFHAAGIGPQEAEAAAIVAMAQLAQKRGADARATAVAARPMATFGTAITLDTVTLAVDQKLDALGDLAARAGAAGFVTRSFDARMALAEVTLASGNRDGGRALLLALSKDAAARGFNGVATRANAILADQRL
jgi:ATP/maltotriose-dependent transcriptional regulator MalT